MGAVQEGAPEWNDFEIAPSGKYLGVPLGRATEADVLAAPLAKWRTRADGIAHVHMPPVAARVLHRQRVLPVLLYVAGMYRAARDLARLERDASCRILRLAGSVVRMRWNLDLHDWGFVEIPNAESACARDSTVVAGPLLASKAGHGKSCEPCSFFHNIGTRGPGVPIAIARRDALTPHAPSRPVERAVNSVQRRVAECSCAPQGRRSRHGGCARR